MNTTCDKCSTEFEINLITVKVTEEIEKSVFRCPSCHNEYISHYTDDKIREMQKEQKVILKEYQEARKIVDNTKARKLKRKYDRHLHKTIMRMNKLQAKYTI